MPLKLNKSAFNNLLANNVSALDADKALPANTTYYYNLLQVVAQVFDDLAHGEDVYMILGATTKKDAYTCTIKFAGAPTTVFGTSLEDLSAKLADLL